MLEVRQLRAHAAKLWKQGTHRKGVKDALKFSTAIEYDRLFSFRRRPDLVVGDDGRAARRIFVEFINPSPEGNAGLPDRDGCERGPRVGRLACLAKGKLRPGQTPLLAQSFCEPS